MQPPNEAINDEIGQIEHKAIPVLAKHFWLFYAISILIAILACYHKVFTVLPHPVISTGVTAQIHKTYETRMYSRYSGTYTVKSFARRIQFNYQGQNYEVIGGWDEDMGEGVNVKVIFDASHPGQGQELSWPGLIDFPVFRRVVPVWILISGFLFALASSNSHFTAFNFNVPVLTTRSFICLLIIVLFIPIYPSVDLLLFGKKTDGVMTGDFQCPDGRCLNAIVFTAGGNQYATYSQYANEYEQGVGKHFPIIYRPDNPNRCNVYEMEALYSNAFVVLMIISLLVIVPWFIASRP